MSVRVATLLCLAWLAGCATSSFRDSIFDDGVVRYRVGRLDPRFSRVEVDDNDLAWHGRGVGTISVNSTCSEYEDVPAVALMNHLLFGTSERTLRLEETTTLDGRGALHTIADVELDGVPITLEVYLLKKDGCVYDLSHIAARHRFEQSRPLFAAFVAQFHVLSTRLPE
jgi:hypothetical protein